MYFYTIHQISRLPRALPNVPSLLRSPLVLIIHSHPLHLLHLQVRYPWISGAFRDFPADTINVAEVDDAAVQVGAEDLVIKVIVVVSNVVNMDTTSVNVRLTQERLTLSKGKRRTQTHRGHSEPCIGFRCRAWFNVCEPGHWGRRFTSFVRA